MSIALILRYWREGIIALCLIAVGVQSLRLAASEREAAKWQSQLAKANALIEIQNEAVAALEAEGKELRANVERARKEGEAGIRRADRLASELEKERPLSGQCLTPEAVLRADL